MFKFSKATLSFWLATTAFMQLNFSCVAAEDKTNTAVQPASVPENNKAVESTSTAESVVPTTTPAIDPTSIPPAPTPTAPSGATASPARKPLQGSIKKDTKGTPLVPPWRVDAGYDELVGTFYYGLLGLKMVPRDTPGGTHVLMGKSKIERWQGHKPTPCIVKLTKLADGSGGYWFHCLTDKEGPHGWIMPHEKEEHKHREWGIYFLQPSMDSATK